MNASTLVLYVGTLAVVLAAALLVMRVFWVVACILRDWFAHRARERRMQRVTIADWGEWTSDDGQNWEATVRGLPVSVRAAGGPPGDPDFIAVTSVIDTLDALILRAAEYLFEENAITGDARPTEIVMVAVTSETEFTLTLGDPTDTDGCFDVEFRGGLPVSFSYTH